MARCRRDERCDDPGISAHDRRHGRVGNVQQLRNPFGRERPFVGGRESGHPALADEKGQGKQDQREQRGRDDEAIAAVARVVDRVELGFRILRLLIEADLEIKLLGVLAQAADHLAALDGPAAPDERDHGVARHVGREHCGDQRGDVGQHDRLVQGVI